MKLLITFSILSFSIFIQSNTMDKAIDDKPPYPIRGIFNNIIPMRVMEPRPPLVLAVRDQDEKKVDELLAQTQRGNNPQDEVDALAGAILKGNISILRKLLIFFGNQVTTSDADWAFAVASVSDDDQTALEVITELCSHQAFVIALSTNGLLIALMNTRKRQHYEAHKHLSECKQPHKRT